MQLFVKSFMFDIEGKDAYICFCQKDFLHTYPLCFPRYHIHSGGITGVKEPESQNDLE